MAEKNYKSRVKPFYERGGRVYGSEQKEFFNLTSELVKLDFCAQHNLGKYWALEAYLCILLVATIAANCMSIFKLYKQSKRSVTSAGHDSNLACFVGLNLSSINLAVGILGE